MSSFPPSGPPPQGPPPGPPGGYGPGPGQPPPGYGPPPQPGYGAAPGYGPQPYGAPPGGGSNGLAIGALVVGIIGLITVWVPFLGIVLGLVALVLGIVGRKKANETGVGGGMAIAGLIMGVLAILGGILWIVFVAALFNAADQQLQEDFGSGFGDIFEDSQLCSQGDQDACDRLGIPNPQEQ